MTTLSNIKKEPFLYSQINNILTPSENKFLYDYAINYIESRKDEYNVGSFFILDERMDEYKNNGMAWAQRNHLLQANVGISNYKNSFTREYENTLNVIKERLYGIIDEYSDIFPPLYKEFEYFQDVDISSFSELTPRIFGASVCISSFFECTRLLPHTDWILELQKEDNVDDLRNVTSGRYKGVIYIGDENLDYTGYGTRVYENHSIDSEIEEIPYIPGNGIIFRSEPNSYHGTDYPKNSKNPRITITFEYY